MCVFMSLICNLLVDVTDLCGGANGRWNKGINYLKFKTIQHGEKKSFWFTILLNLLSLKFIFV
jgi:hypothetical protein